MRCFVTGCAGFIGSHLTDRLLALGYEVVGYDNFSTGLESFLQQAFSSPHFQFIYGDLLNAAALTAAMKNCDIVFHLAANADVRFGTEHPRKDLEQNTLATFNVLEAMRVNQIKRIVFSSTGSVYGEAAVFPTPETAPFPIQTSLYGASKLACESLISAYCEGFDFQGYIFRFVSILGERYTHGHVLDFYKQLQQDPTKLYILGDGHQRKSYLYVHDCIDAIFICLEKSQEKVNLFNLGTDEYCEVNDSAGWISQAVGATPAFSYSGGNKGWFGDNPFIFLDCNKVRALDWRPKLSIRQGVEATVRFFQQQPWILEARA
jgi:UDP-glucose 4-epimerase